MLTTPRVCVVGGGPAGLVAARALQTRGIAYDVYERHHAIGGLWDQHNPGSPVYDSAHFISSKTQSHFPGFPMPDNYPDYPSHGQILAYIRAFADAYQLSDHIHCGVGVDRAEYDGQQWQITTADGQQHHYTDLICATGTNWYPTMPHYPGQFTGDLRHVQTYRSMDELRGKRVLIIGAGNSGCDIACDAAQAADTAVISMRRGYHFIPKHVFGVPADVFGASGPHLPMWIEQPVFAALLRLLNGDLTRYGLPTPDHRLFESHPILNSRLLHYLAHGDISVKPDVARFDGDTVHFVDGSAADFDVVLCATGYTWRIPYVDAAALGWRDGRPDFYLNMVSRQTPGLYALGYVETNGAAYPLFDDMAQWLVQAIATRAAGGSARQRLEALIQGPPPDVSGGIRFVNSPRHVAYVDSVSYRSQLGAVRRHMGWQTPVHP